MASDIAFGDRMQKYQGWIANITECHDFQMTDIAEEKPFHQLLWPLEITESIGDMFQVLHNATEEMVDRLNSPLVDAVYHAYHACHGQTTKFLADLCAQGSTDALEFCMNRDHQLFAQNDTFTDCLAAAIEHNRMAVVKRLMIEKPLYLIDGSRFREYVFGMKPLASKDLFILEMFFTTQGRLCDTVRKLANQGGLEMIQWMIQFMKPAEVKFYIFYVALEINAEEVVRIVYHIVKESIEERMTTTSKLIIQNNAIRCAKALYELGTQVFTTEWHMRDACQHGSLMPSFLYLVEELKLPVHREQLIIDICSETNMNDRAIPQLEYLLTHAAESATDDEKNYVIRELLFHDVNHVMLFKVLDHGFATPQFPELMAPYVGERLRGKTKEGFLDYLKYGVPCDENAMCAVIGEPENAAIVLERGGEQVLTRKVWDFMIQINYVINPTVWDWFTARGFSQVGDLRQENREIFEIDEKTLENARSSYVLEWCLGRMPAGLLKSPKDGNSGLLTGHDAFTANIHRNNYINCHRLVAAGLKPTQVHLTLAKTIIRKGRRTRSDAKNIIDIVEKNAIAPVLGKRKTRSTNPVYKT